MICNSVSQKEALSFKAITLQERTQEERPITAADQRLHELKLRMNCLPDDLSDRVSASYTFTQ